MKQRQIEHPSFLRLLNNIVSDIPVKKSGTYNRQDPTAFEKGDQDFEHNGKRFNIEFSDITWGIEITISKYVPRFPDEEEYAHPNPNDTFLWRKKEIAGFYISRENRYDSVTSRWENYEVVILRQKGTKGMAGLLSKAFKHVLAPNFKSKKQKAYDEYMSYQDNECWTDPAGGEHHGYEEDPAKMYE